MADSQHVIVGRVSTVYGIKGWVKIASFTDPRENIFDYHPWFLKKKGAQGKWQKIEIDANKISGKSYVAHVVGVDDREMAKELVGSDIGIEKSQLPALQPGEYYWSDLQGLVVITPEGVCLGKVKNLIETGANDVLVVMATKESTDDRERLIPYLPEQVVQQVDLDEGKMIVDWDVDF